MTPGDRTGRLSAPPRLTLRALADPELKAARAVADVLVPRAGVHPAATEDPDFDTHLARALSARRDAFDAITDVLADLDVSDPIVLREQLRTMSRRQPELFQALSTVIAGAWLISPRTRQHIGYPGQRSATFSLDAGTDELASGLLDPVLARGPIGRPTST